MFSKIITIVALYVITLLLMALQKPIFLMWYAERAAEASASDLWGVVWNGLLLDSTTAHAQLARATYRDVTLTCWHRGRWVLLGDAAHAMSPQLGQGVNMALLDAEALRDALRTGVAVPDALAAYAGTRRRHVGIYQFWSRWLTPVFQSDRDTIARARDLAFLPMGRMPGGRGHMLRVLSGTQQGAFGSLTLAPDFVDALAGVEPASALDFSKA